MEDILMLQYLDWF